ncbi:hypothetical protein F0562_019943 [Nyssa sinensis]|uniref:Uncharacterized protein n=1 Tax=Nyssa sinensis TaxID=561372 RepID=A0A5J5BQN3_9ASTE|nr:hypothetical protein F0562_019943 [Nyssa sinensis]
MVITSCGEDLTEERNSLTEKIRRPLYRKVGYLSILPQLVGTNTRDLGNTNFHHVGWHEEHTILHAVQTCNKTNLYLSPVPSLPIMTDMKVGRSVQTILNLAGFENVKSEDYWLEESS